MNIFFCSNVIGSQKELKIINKNDFFVVMLNFIPIASQTIDFELYFNVKINILKCNENG